MSQRRLVKPALFICDLQENFRPVIWEFPKIIQTTIKLLRAASILQLPIYVTTQSRSKLGGICDELMPYLTTTTNNNNANNTNKNNVIEDLDKTAFSMWVPGIARHFEGGPERQDIAIVGIEAHICVTQTVLDALRNGHRVYVLADAVGSGNRHEVRWALERLRAEGAVITTSESWLFEVLGDAGREEFRAVSGLVKEFKVGTREGLEMLSRI